MEAVLGVIPRACFYAEPRVVGVGVECLYEAHALVSCRSRQGEEFGGAPVPAALRPASYPDRFLTRGTVWARGADRERVLAMLRAGETRDLRYAPWDQEGLTPDLLRARHRDPRWTSQVLDYLHLCGHRQPFTRSNPGDMFLRGLERHLSQLRTEREFLWASSGIGMPTTGVVVKVEDPEHRAMLERWAFRFDFDDSTAATELLSVDWVQSPGGFLVPVGSLAPVRVAGETVSQVPLLGLPEMRESGILRIPCPVLVTVAHGKVTVKAKERE